jgi:hypothetical protein
VDTERSSPDMDKSPMDCCVKEIDDDVCRDLSFKGLKRTRWTNRWIKTFNLPE